MKRLHDKTAVISGAAHGMGAEQARLFAAEGAGVVVADVSEADGRQVVAEIEAAGGRAAFARTDVTSEADWERTIAFAVAQFGKLDILVNNAGLSATSAQDQWDTDGWHRIIGVNATGVFLGTKHAIPALKQAGGGAIVNISSIAALVGNDFGHPAYAVAKGGMRAFTRAVAAQCGPYGIRVNTVFPGFFPAMQSANAAGLYSDDVLTGTPLRRFGERNEMAAGVLFLVSDEASFITGAELVVDGGYTAVK